MPALTPRVTACMRSRLWVHTAAARPYSVALARWMTCSMRGGPALGRDIDTRVGCQPAGAGT